VNPQYAGRILALDLGRRRIGLALSDELRLTAQGLETLERTNIREDIARLGELIRSRGVTCVVVGNPMRLDGSEGAQSAWAREFAARLRRATGVEVVAWDERLTTVEAERVLKQSGISRARRNRAVDRLAAVILLEHYLDTVARKNPPEGRSL